MDYNIFSDEELVQMAKKNDDNSTSILINRFENFISQKAQTYSLRYYSIKDDLVQIGNIVLLNAIKRYDFGHESKSKFKTFLNTCLENKFKSIINNINRKNIGNIGSDIFDFSESDKNKLISDTRYNPEEIIINKETELEIKSVSTKILSVVEQEVYNLKQLGYKNSEISSRLNINKKSVENALTRIKQKFTKNVKDNDFK